MPTNSTPEATNGEEILRNLNEVLPDWHTATAVYRDRSGRIVGYGRAERRGDGGMNLEVTDDLSAWEGDHDEAD